MDVLTLLAIGFAGTFFWPLSPEAAVALGVAQRGWRPLLAALLAAVGQGTAHAVLYRFGAELRRRWPWFERKCQRARARHGRWLERGAVPLALTGGLLGLPPSSVTAALAPGLGLRARVMLPLLFVSRFIRLGVIAALAAVALRHR
jgi:hypothetical protein